MTVLLGGTAMVIAAGTFHAAAQDAATEGETVLESIEIKAKKAAPGSLAESPTTTQTSSEDIRQNQITNIQDLGNTTEPGVNFSSTANSINIRGLQDDRVLTTIDGVRVPYMPDYARDAYGGVNSFDFTSLATVDVVRGADSSRGGSGMLGGALVLRTLEPEDLITGDKDWGAFIQSTYDSRDSSVLGSAAFARRFGATSVLLQGSYRRGHETETNGDVAGQGRTRSLANPRDYDQTNLLFKVRHELEGGHTIGLSAERFDYDGFIDLMTSQGAGTGYDIGFNNGIDKTRRERVSLDYRYESPGDGWLDAAQATFYWQRLTREDGNVGVRNTAPLGGFMQLSDNRNKTLGLAGSAEKSFATGKLSHRLAVGIDISATRTSQYADGYTSCDTAPAPLPPICDFYHLAQADMPDVDGKRIGVFIDDKISFGESGFSLTPGIRFDWFDYSPESSANWLSNSSGAALPPGRTGHRFSPKLRAAYEIDPNVEIYAQWSMGFRAPNVGELYYRYAKTSGMPTYEVIGNENLKPETSNGIEVGANFGDDRFGGRLGAFYNRYTNFIDSVTLPVPNPGYGTTQQMMNIDNVRIFGFEAELHKRFDNGIHVRGALSYANGENLDTGLLLDSIPPLKVVAGLGYSAETWGVDVTAIGVKGVSNRSQATFKVPGYGIVNLSGWWEPEWVEGLRLQAGVFNLFDRTYYDAVSRATVDFNNPRAPAQPVAYYSEPGRTFKLSMTKQF